MIDGGRMACRAIGSCLLCVFLCGTLATPPDALAIPVPRLFDQLRTELRAGRPVEIAFLTKVVELVEQDTLPYAMVQSSMLWARTKLPHPFPYFQRVLRLRAAQIGVEVP
jgi:hypothetical protein